MWTNKQTSNSSTNEQTDRQGCINKKKMEWPHYRRTLFPATVMTTGRLHDHGRSQISVKHAKSSLHYYSAVAWVSSSSKCTGIQPVQGCIMSTIREIPLSMADFLWTSSAKPVCRCSLLIRWIGLVLVLKFIYPLFIYPPKALCKKTSAQYVADHFNISQKISNSYLPSLYHLYDV